MLCISRKNGESVVVGDVRIIVKEAKDGRVKLVIDAPASVKILRGELVGQPKRKAG